MCVCACVRACVRARVCVCVCECVRERGVRWRGDVEKGAVGLGGGVAEGDERWRANGGNFVMLLLIDCSLRSRMCS